MSSFPDSTPSDDTITIPLTRGYETIVDAVDADLAELKWYVQICMPNGEPQYAIRKRPTKNGKRGIVIMHRVVLERALGRQLTEDEYVDHKNGNGLDNRRTNLRVASPAQNKRNQRLYKNNLSGLKGVRKPTKGKKWAARIRHNGKLHNLGYFNTPEDAHEAYCEAAKRLHGEFARFE